jgi:hypothetical protein
MMAALQFDPGPRRLNPAAPAFVPGPIATLELVVVHPLNLVAPAFVPGSMAAQELALVCRLNPEAPAFAPKLLTALKADLKRLPTGTPPTPDFCGLPFDVRLLIFEFAAEEEQGVEVHFTPDLNSCGVQRCSPVICFVSVYFSCFLLMLITINVRTAIRNRPASDPCFSISSA